MIRVLLPAVFIVASATSLPAQQILFGSLGGTVVNAHGMALEGAAVTILTQAARVQRSVISGKNGEFLFSHLPSGNYKLSVHRDGYEDSGLTAVIGASSAANVSIVITLAERQPGTPVQQFKVLPDSDGIGVLTDATGSLTPHGEIYWSLGHEPMLSPNEPTPLLQLPLAQYGAAMQVGNERTSLFASFDQHTFSREQLLAEILANSPSALSANQQRLVSNEFLARVGHRFDQRDSVEFRYSRSAANGNPVFPAMQEGNGLQQMLAVHNTMEISPRTVNETQGEFVAGNMHVPSGAPAYGIQANVATLRRYQIYEAANNLYHQMGGGALQSGGDFNYSRMSVSFLQAGLGSFSDATRSTGFYVLNQWRVKPNLSLTAGARYDLQFLSSVETDTNNVAPQLGFAWSPAGSKGIVIRGGYGLMYAQIALPAIAGGIDPSNGAINMARSGSFTNLRDPARLGSVASFTSLDPAMQNAYAEQASVEIEQPVGSRGVIEAAYQHVRGIELAEPVARTAPLCATANSCNAGNTFAGNGLQFASAGNSSYDGIVVSFAQHPTQWGDYRVAYTRATTQGFGAPEFLAFASDEIHRASFTGTIHTPLTGATGWWEDLNHGLVLSGYGDMTSRENLPGLDFVNLNARLAKVLQLGSRARLECFAEAVDLMGHRTYSLDKASTELSEYGMGVLSSYERFSTLGASNTQAGLRLSF